MALSARQELEAILDDFREADRKEKEGKKAKEKLKPTFMQLITEIIRDEEPLARKSFTVSLYEDPREYVAINYPGWLVVSVEVEDGLYKITIEEDPEVKKYEVTFHGYKYGRTVVEGPTTMDVDRLWEEHPELRDIMIEEKIHSIDESKAKAKMVEDPSVKTIFDQYIEVGPPTVKLLPITKVKE